MYTQGRPVQFQAGAAIDVSRCVSIVGDSQVNTAGNNAIVIGISQEGSQDAPLGSSNNTFAARAAGDSVMVYPPGSEAPAVAGAAINAGERLMSDANSAVVPVGSSNAVSYNAVGFAISGAGSGEKCKVFVWPHTYRPSA